MNSKKLRTQKYVYLFELDSVRKTNEEIIEAQKALYNEIVKNGNIVVLTFNQLVDSRGFFSLLDNYEYKNALYRLFKEGAIKISQYGEFRTIIHYLLNALDPDNNYYFSAIPLKRSQRRLMALIRRSLIYSDLNEIQEYLIQKNKSDEDIKNLFIEAIEINVDIEKMNHETMKKTLSTFCQCNFKKTINNLFLESEKQYSNRKSNSLTIEQMSEILVKRYQNRSNEDIKSLFMKVNKQIETKENDVLSIKEMKEILENLYHFLEIIFELNSIPSIYICPRNSEDLKGKNFSDILKIVCEWNFDNDCLYGKSVSILTQLNCFGENDRSVYHNALRDVSKNDTNKTAYQYAEAIVDLCCNYTYELSIRNISKHYSVDELRIKDGNYPTFQADFYNRLQQTWNNGTNAAQRYLLPETNVFEEFECNKLPIFSDAVRVVKYNKCFFRGITENDKVFGYEVDLEQQQKIYKKSIIKRTSIELISVFVGTAIVFFVELLIQAIQNAIEGQLNFTQSIHMALLFAGKTIVFLIVAELISALFQIWMSKLTAKKEKSISSLGEAVVNIKEIILSAKRILLNKCESYKNNRAKQMFYEDYNNGEAIDVVTPKEMKKYIKFKKNNIDKGYFEHLASYPIADMEDDKTKKELLKLEEIYQYNFGIPYESKYNTLVVDPVSGNENPFSYERILPTGGRGVVVVAKYNDKFVLLQQARHAIRDIQICFPRGFNEDDLEPFENAIKEIKEEINPSYIGKPIFLGNISADSGLIGSKACAYYVNVKCDNIFQPSEGITNIVYKTEEEMDNMIRNKEIDDGFTLSAYMLYKCMPPPKGDCA